MSETKKHNALVIKAFQREASFQTHLSENRVTSAVLRAQLVEYKLTIEDLYAFAFAPAA